MSVWIVDASVLIKSVIDEPGNAIATSIWAGDHRFVAPVSAIPECANALLKKVRHERLPERAALDALREIERAPVEYAALHGFHLVSLFAAARTTGITAHDCAYLLLAEDRDARLVTADRRLVKVTIKHGRWADRVTALEDWVG